MKQSTDGTSAPPEIPAEEAMQKDWWREFDAAAQRPLKKRLDYAFIRTYKPILDDVNYRSFDSMEDYRRWCEKHLPDWLGYGRV